ncbi:MAG: hypothetical protein JXQ90_02875 [Cyclobacteriaceae bacterium]
MYLKLLVTTITLTIFGAIIFFTPIVFTYSKVIGAIMLGIGMVGTLYNVAIKHSGKF